MAKDVTRHRNKTEKRLNLKLTEIQPKTGSQEHAFQAWQSGQNLVLHGVAGTGKTFISLYLALKDVYEHKKEKVIIVRSAVSTREQGFLPGSIEEKQVAYETPYKDMIDQLCGSFGAYESLKENGVLEFMTTSYIRGLNFKDCAIIVDECQNMTDHEFNSIMTRLCENTQIVLVGDWRQSDFATSKRKEVSGIDDMLMIVDEMPSFTLINFSIEDIVRSGVVREYILARVKLNLD